MALMPVRSIIERWVTPQFCVEQRQDTLRLTLSEGSVWELSWRTLIVRILREMGTHWTISAAENKCEWWSRRRQKQHDPQARKTP